MYYAKLSTLVFIVILCLSNMGLNAQETRFDEVTVSAKTVETPAYLNENRPIQPGGIVAADNTENSISISWGAAPNAEETMEYEVFVNNVLESIVQSTSIKIKGLECGTSYRFKVRSLDKIGNKSPFSIPVEIHTLDCLEDQHYVFIEHRYSGRRVKMHPDKEVMSVSFEMNEFTQWEVVDIDHHNFYLVHKATGEKLYSQDGQKIHTTTASNTSSNAQWYKQRVGKGWYRIVHRGSGKWLRAELEGQAFQLSENTIIDNSTLWKFETVRGIYLLTDVQLLEDPESEQWNVFPNPVTNILTVEGVEEGSVVQVSDLYGKSWFEQQDISQVDMSDFPSGVYIIRINDKFVGKFIRK